MEERVLRLPPSIKNASDGLELIRVWVSETDHWVSLFLSKEWTLENYSEIAFDVIRLLSDQLAEKFDIETSKLIIVIYQNIFRQDETVSDVQKHYKNKVTGNIGSEQLSPKQQEVHRQMLPIPVADDDLHETVEVLRGWADGEKLQLSLRTDYYETPLQCSYVCQAIITHMANAMARDAESNDNPLEYEIQLRTSIAKRYQAMEQRI